MHKLVIYMAANVFHKDDSLLDTVAGLAGGCTLQDAQGLWIGDDGHLCDEQAATITIFCPTRGIAGDILALVVDRAGECGEQAIMVDWTGPDGRVMTRGEVKC